MPKIILKSKFFKSKQHIYNYIQYIARQGMLFSGLQDIDVNEALQTMRKYSNTVCWRHIYSLREEDVHRLEIDRDYMKALIESQKNEIGKALHISPKNLILYASYHNVAHHPHLHFIVRSKTRSEGFIVRSKDQDLDEAFKPTRERIKSSLTNEIFREDLHQLKVEKSNTRNELNKQLKQRLEIGKTTHYVSKEVSQKMQQLSQELRNVSGKKVYGYLPPHLKQQVDDILQTIVETDPTIKKLFLQYRSNQQNIIDDSYAENKETVAKKMKDWETSFFHPAKGEDTQRHNIIIRTANEQFNSERYKKKQNHFKFKEKHQNISHVDITQSYENSWQSTKEQQQKREFSSKKRQNYQSCSEQYKEKNDYHHKSQNAAIRSMLYYIGQSLHEDNRRLTNSSYYTPHKKAKHQVKKIQKEIQVDQINHIEVGGM